ncbi:DDE-type integrase/transposase/recombinase [Nocardia brasiliensis]|uniref:DDE-type integrase/transposase/recombinase n=1 Tax=Nocardia brasiliensis TaxID=37326 RepID=UPI002457E534|nr:DDE-type integrase/transposase/recombinase [Nocardia brasiliensis]
MIETVTELVSVGVAITVGCVLLGLARSVFYRITRGYRHYQPETDPVAHAQRYQPAALTAGERAAIIAVLTAPDYADLSVVQAYWRAFDAGLIGCSQRSFYRVANAENLVGDRRRVRHPGVGSRRTPVVVAGGVGDLWSWDITELRGPRAQDRYKLYLVIDVFSRHPVGWRVEHNEDKQLAVEMFTAAIAEHGTPKVVHADNGAPMRSQVLIDLLHTAGALTSYSRPRVSDDNPFSESLFKTIKYDLDCPDRFDSIDHARAWTHQFLHRYATEHRHSGLGYHTPATVHHNTATEIHRQRQAHLDRYWNAHPERFHRRPTPPALPTTTGINTHLSQAG